MATTTRRIRAKARKALLTTTLMSAALLGVSSAATVPVDTLRLSLAGAIRTAVEQSPASTQAAVTRSDGAITLARGINGVLPAVSGSVGYGWEHEDDSAGTGVQSRSWTAALTVNQVVFSPSVFAGVVSSAIRLAYSRTSARDQQARIVYDATVDYLNLIKYSRLRDVATAALLRTDEYLELTREKQRRGLASSIDLLRAEAQEAQARLGLLKAEQDLGIGMETFKATAGLGRNTVVVPTESLETPGEFEVVDPDSLVGEIERRNPGIRMAAQSRTIARVNQVATIGSVLPNVSLYWQRSSSDASLPSCLADWRDGGSSSYGLRATLPLLDLKSYVLDVVDASNDSRRASASSRLAALQIRSTAVSSVGAYLSARAALRPRRSDPGAQRAAARPGPGTAPARQHLAVRLPRRRGGPGRRPGGPYQRDLRHLCPGRQHQLPAGTGRTARVGRTVRRNALTAGIVTLALASARVVIARPAQAGRNLACGRSGQPGPNSTEPRGGTALPKRPG